MRKVQKRMGQWGVLPAGGGGVGGGGVRVPQVTCRDLKASIESRCILCHAPNLPFFFFIKRVCSPDGPGWVSVLGQKETFSPVLLSSFTTGAWKNAHFGKRRARVSTLKASSVLGTSGVKSSNL